ncbi:amino acid ABC transporter permease [Microbacterium foliorum]|uniref:Putative glutamine ABC transporter permease protein GlnP n=1 Tax=Microbacterium foliorum TaxID=104336 RepID=A0A0F0L0D1_9MICO|nr:amino acid ABC transporter permease [Microbacterium foliorum]AXL13841.1 amino acid ABC transporter permease [Microbacterium foliorum]KJL26563.1 putative glutamine ABC transporter permease protein GlnP [Microbacterium foliorum]CAH0241664.1 putative glutamine ABC transporter permease protein GlnP [Microbacterium foliorum]CAH0245032.1 putative glutamine ABC transporter permease protein GlnP [Microbacterium foliorum]
MSSVLFDVPGPRAIARNRLIGVATILVVLAVLGWVVWRLIATGQFSAEKWNIFTFSAVWVRFGEGLLSTLAAFVVAGVGAIALGFLLGIGRLSEHAWVREPVRWIIEVLRAVPVLILMMLLYYGLPVIGVKMPPYWAVVIALIVYNGSVLAEVLRAGIESLPRGQKEAGYAIGLRKTGVMYFILIPQAVRAMMPVIIAQLVVALKDTALGFIITYQELLYVINQIGNQAPYGSPLIPAALVGGSMYVAVCLLLSYVAFRLQKRARRSPAQTAAAGNVAADDESTLTQVIALQKGAGTSGLDGGSGRV